MTKKVCKSICSKHNNAACVAIRGLNQCTCSETSNTAHPLINGSCIHEYHSSLSIKPVATWQNIKLVDILKGKYNNNHVHVHVAIYMCDTIHGRSHEHQREARRMKGNRYGTMDRSSLEQSNRGSTLIMYIMRKQVDIF